MKKSAGMMVCAAALCVVAQSRNALAGDIPADAMWSNGSQTNGTIIVSNQINAGEAGWYLFNKSTSGKWLATSVPAWAVYQFANGDKWAVTNYVLGSGNDEPNRDPKVWRIEGSNDLAGNTIADVLAATWTRVDTRTNETTFAARNTEYSFGCPDNYTAYNAYRLFIESTHGGAATQLSEWRVTGTEGAAWILDFRVDDVTHDVGVAAGTFAKFTDEPFTLHVVYGDEDYGTDLAAWQRADSATVDEYAEPAAEFAFAMTGLTAASDYVARVVAISASYEIWTGVATFTTFSANPEIVSHPASGITGTAALLSGELLYAGGGAAAATVTLYWGESDGGENPVAWSNAVAVGTVAPSAFTNALDALVPNTPYYFRHHASSVAGTAWAPETQTFTSKGVAVFGEPYASAFPASLKFTVALLDAGAAPVDVTCWYGTHPDELSQMAGAWQRLTTPQTLTCALDNLAPGTTLYFAFVGESVMPGGAPAEAWTATHSGTTRGREVIWDNAANNRLWDLASANWHLAGNANGTALFEQGDSARFTLAANQTVTLAQDTDANEVFVALSGNYPVLTFGGAGRTLSLNGDMNLSGLGTVTLNDVRLSGDGGISNHGVTLNLGNDANDFADGFWLWSGAANATATAAASTVLGADHVTLGDLNEDVSVGAVLTVAAKDTDAKTVTVASDLLAAGSMNSGRLALDASHDDAEGIAVRFERLRQLSGASLTFYSTRNFAQNPGGPNEYIFFDSLADGEMLPPWAVVARNGGDYAQYSGTRGIVRATLDATDFSGASDAFVNIAAATALEADAAAQAVRVAAELDLAGNTLATEGLLLRNASVVDSAGTGAIDIGASDLFVYAEGTDNNNVRFLDAPVVGSGTIRKFGTGMAGMKQFGGGANIVAQEGTLVLMPDTATTVAENLGGAGKFQVRNAVVTLAGDDINVNGMHLHSGGLTVSAGVHVRNRGIFASGPVQQADRLSSDLRIVGGGRWTQVNGGEFHVGSGRTAGHMTVLDNTLLLAGESSMLDMGGGTFILGGYDGNNSTTYTNSAHITDGAVLTNAATFNIAYSQGGRFGKILVDNGARVYTAGTAVGGGFGSNNGGGHWNRLVITGADTFWDNGGGRFAVGSTGGGNSCYGNEIVVTGGAFVDNVRDLGIGYKNGGSGSIVSNNTMTISDNAVVVVRRNPTETTHQITVGAGYSAASVDSLLHVRDGAQLRFEGATSGSQVFVNYGHQGPARRNALRVETGGIVTGVSKLYVGRGWASGAFDGRMEVLPGGRVTLSGDTFAEVVVGNAYSGQPNPASTNGLVVAGAGAVFDFAGAPLKIGGGTSTEANRLNARADANFVRVGSGGQLLRVGALTVGSTAGNSVDNRLVFAGGALEAASLAVQPGNIVEIELQADGLAESRVTGEAVFADGTPVRVSLAEHAPRGVYKVLTADEGIIDNGLEFEIDAPGRAHLLRPFIRGNTLYVDYLENTTLIVR